MDDFTRKHADQLASAGIPENLHGELRRKLEDEVFDAGEKLFIALVDIADSEQDEGEASTETTASTTTLSRKVVVRDDYVQDGGGEVFLVDHAWTFQAGSARQHLSSSQHLLGRMAAMMQLPPPSTEKEATAVVAGKEHPTGIAEAGDVEDASGGGREGGEEKTVGACRGEEGGVLERVLSALPTFSRRYGLGGAGRHACYVNDELGSALRHSDRPNFQMAPFLFSGPGGVMAFSVLWPLRRLLPSEEATVDLLWSTAWAGASVAARGSFVRGLDLPQSDSLDQLPDDHPSVALPRNRLAKRQRLMDVWAVENRARKATTDPPTPAAIASGDTTAPAASRKIPDSGKNNDIVAPEVDTSLPMPPGDPRSHQLGVAPEASAAFAKVGWGSEHPLTVWTDLPYLWNGETGLTRSEFRVLESGASPQGADVLWASRSIGRNFEAAMGGLLPGQLVNQFPYEAALVIKSHLARTIQREFGSGSPEGDVMQPTFDLQSEDDALAFIAEFRRRSHDGLDNIWIVKPIGLARSMDTTVTGALAGVLRAADTGPKVAQLYLSRPLLWKGRKFDLRIVALLVSAKPLELYVHNCYWPRVAERPHETERAASLEDPRVSLTATHLVGETAAGEACHPHYEEFARDMQDVISERHPGCTWEGVMVKTRSMILSVFQAAARQQPGMASPRARAMYGCDVMVTEDLEPRLLEVTFSPANLAASPAWPVPQPEFLNEVFGCLFLREQKNVTRLS